MRRFAIGCALLLFVGRAHAQSPLTDHIQLLKPGLTISVFRDLGPDQVTCDVTATGWGVIMSPLLFGSTFACESLRQYYLPLGNGIDAAGAFYQVTPNAALASMDVVRGTTAGDEPIARMSKADGLLLNLALDSTNGRLYLSVHASSNVHNGIVVISGLPQMFDTLLTFIPGGQLAALIPTHPDGFRNADSLQVWTGNVRSMPDWSQAQPLACTAAANPTPGQLVSVEDSLPDPAIGEGRYYIAVSQSGPDRRLGRQYVNGAFSARSPETLPICQ